jgi:hypothetical protein
MATCHVLQFNTDISNGDEEMMNLFRPKYSIFLVMAAFLLAGLLVSPCLAISERMVGEAGYAVQDATMEDTGRNYSGGMDVVYAQVATGTAAGKTRCFLKAEDTLDWNTFTGTLKVMLYDYRGNLVQQVALVDPGMGVYSGAAKLNPAGDTIWFSDTKDASDTGSYYSVSADLDTLTFGTPVEAFVLPGAWEMEWPSAGPQAGTPFFVGKEADYWNDPHAIFIRSGGTWKKVVEIGGYSNGIAFDNAGNLWCGSYTTSGPASQQYAYMFTAAQVNAAITGTPLVPADANQTIALPTFVDNSGEEPITYYTGPNDFECDPDGNVYITLNGGFDEVNNTEAGFVVMLSNDGNNIPPGGYDQSDLIYLAQSNPTQDWDWQKQLAYDGATNIDVGGVTDPTQAGITGNRLFVDQDYGWGSGGPDIVTAVTTDADDDGDLVPDAIDNAYQTFNPDQTDTDQDMYGNIADADFDNDGFVGPSDFGTLRVNYNQAVPPGNPNVDMDGGDFIGPSDFSSFRGRYNSSAPWY